jgi:hypothetical protein
MELHQYRHVQSSSQQMRRCNLPSLEFGLTLLHCHDDDEDSLDSGTEPRLFLARDKAMNIMRVGVVGLVMKVCLVELRIREERERGVVSTSGCNVCVCRLEGAKPAAASPSPPGTFRVEHRSCCPSTQPHSDVHQPYEQGAGCNRRGRGFRHGCLGQISVGVNALSSKLRVTSRCTCQGSCMIKQFKKKTHHWLTMNEQTQAMK